MGAECDLLQKLWNAQRELLSIMDTLLQCTSRIQLASPNQYIDSQEAQYILEGAYLIPSKVLEMQSHIESGTAELAVAKSTLHFLENLGQETHTDKSHEFECPVCLMSISMTNACIFPCGHSLCYDCMTRLVDHRHAKQDMHRLGCPSCRRRFPIKLIMQAANSDHVSDNHPNDKAANSRPKLEGSGGTKIDAVGLKIMSICKEDSESKIL